MQWIILASAIALIILIGCFWLASKALQLQEKAIVACRDAIAAQERTTKMFADRILALKDYAAYGMVQAAETPPRKPRPVRTIRL